jgi:hypothetical protein
MSFKNPGRIAGKRTNSRSASTALARLRDARERLALLIDLRPSLPVVGA